MAGISSYCIGCIIKKQEERIREFTEEEKKRQYMKDLCHLIGESGPEASAPVLVAENEILLEQYFGIKDDYAHEKVLFNELMLKCEDKLWADISQSDDPLLDALKYAQVGNYIDFGALRNVEQDKLMSLLEKAKENPIDQKEYQNLKMDLEKAHTLVYMTDNCGEIVLDKLLIRVIKELYPQIVITALVRGENVLNDATEKDASFVGLDKQVKVMGNGSKVAGTPLDRISKEARTVLEQADVMIAKGQGNFETLNTCGLNIYYLFLCKCSWFEMRFGLKQYAPVLINDRHLQNLSAADKKRA